MKGGGGGGRGRGGREEWLPACLQARLSTHYLIVCGTADFTCSVSVVDKQPEAVQVTLGSCQVGGGIPFFVFQLRVKLKFRQDLHRRERERAEETEVAETAADWFWFWHGYGHTCRTPSLPWKAAWCSTVQPRLSTVSSSWQWGQEGGVADRHIRRCALVLWLEVHWTLLNLPHQF